MHILDIARGAYVRSPPVLRQTVAPFLSLLPTRWRFGKNYRHWREQIARARSDPAFAANQHVTQLRKLIASTHQASEFYRSIIDKSLGASFDATRFTPELLARLPILDKASLQQAGDSALIASRRQLDRSTTSGSNIEPPFSFYLDKDRSAREMAFVYDAWSTIGFSETDKRACFRGFAMSSDGCLRHQWDPALRELKLAVFPMDRTDAAFFLDQIDHHQIRFLYGYPSAIELFCRRLYELGRRPRMSIAGIMPISEPISSAQRSFIRSVLGDVAFSCFYGLSEKVLFATTDEDDDIYTFNPLYGLAELVDRSGARITEPGKAGRLVGTGFLSTGMPFIRYDTGDRAELVEAAAPENGERLRVRALTPRRKPGFLIDRNGDRIVTVDLTEARPEIFTGIAEVQFYQDRPGEAIMRHVPEETGTPSDVERLLRYVQGRVGDRITFKPVQVDQIACGRHGKRSFIVQCIDLEP